MSTNTRRTPPSLAILRVLTSVANPFVFTSLSHDELDELDRIADSLQAGIWDARIAHPVKAPVHIFAAVLRSLLPCHDPVDLSDWNIEALRHASHRLSQLQDQIVDQLHDAAQRAS